MAQETIPRGILDPYYRYTMPTLLPKVEGKGNTVLSNVVEVARSLARPPLYLTKFFAFELSARATIDEARGKYAVKGAHTQHELLQILDDFIDRFVICKKCDKNPETYITIHNGLIGLHCFSCGGRTSVDMRHKMSTFILKNPPPPPPDKMGVAKLMEKTQAPPMKPVKKRDQTQSDTSTSSSDDDVVWHDDVSRRAAEQLLLGMRAFLSTSPTNTQILSKLQEEKEKFGLDDTQTGKLIFLALFDSDVREQIQSDKLELVKQVVTNTDGQAGILAGLTELANKDPAVQKVVPHVLQHLYLESVLSEEVVLQWHARKSRGDKKVKQAALVFVQWLATAEEEDSE